MGWVGHWIKNKAPVRKARQAARRFIRMIPRHFSLKRLTR